MTTTVIKTVGPGKDYASLSAALIAEATDLVAADQILILECYSFTDTTNALVTGFTTDPTHYLQIRTPLSERFTTPAWDTTKYVLQPVTSVGTPYALRINNAYVRIEGLQINCDPTSTASGGSVIVAPSTLSSDVRIERCLIQNSIGFSALAGNGINLSTIATIRVSNNAIWNCAIGIISSAAIAGIIAQNTVVANAVNGIVTGGASTPNLRIVNCYAGGNATTDLQLFSAPEKTTCATSDATGNSGLTSIAYSDSSGALFTNVTSGTEDFTLQASSPLRDRGTVISDLTDDILHTFRVIYDIGCYEYADPVSGVIFERTILQTPRPIGFFDMGDYWVPPVFTLYLEQEEHVVLRTTSLPKNDQYTVNPDEEPSFIYVDFDEPFFPQSTRFTTYARFTDGVWDEPYDLVFAYFYLYPDEPFFPAVTTFPIYSRFTDNVWDEPLDLPTFSIPTINFNDDDAFVGRYTTYPRNQQFNLPQNEEVRLFFLLPDEPYFPQVTTFTRFCAISDALPSIQEDQTSFIYYDHEPEYIPNIVKCRFDTYARSLLSIEGDQIGFFYIEENDAFIPHRTNQPRSAFILPVDDDVRAYTTLINDEDTRAPSYGLICFLGLNRPIHLDLPDELSFIYCEPSEETYLPPLPPPIVYEFIVQIDNDLYPSQLIDEAFTFTQPSQPQSFQSYIWLADELHVPSLEEESFLSLAKWPLPPLSLFRDGLEDFPALHVSEEDDTRLPLLSQRITYATACFIFEVDNVGLYFVQPGYDEITGRIRTTSVLTGYARTSPTLTGKLRTQLSITGYLRMVQDILAIGCDVDIEWFDAEFASDDSPVTTDNGVTATAQILNADGSLVIGSNVTASYDATAGCWRATFPGTINLTENAWYYPELTLVTTTPAQPVVNAESVVRLSTLLNYSVAIQVLLCLIVLTPLRSIIPKISRGYSDARRNLQKP